MKRMFDVVVSALLLIVLAVPLIAVGITIRIRMGSPVLFRQERPGRDARPFILVKFRTMREEHQDGPPVSDRDRTTRLGQVLRSTSLDELPELWNVLRGDMSLVGPRPLLTKYLEHYTAEQRRRHAVRPGITGWAQVRGRNSLSWEEKFVLDVWYVDHRSFRLDLRILALTVTALLRPRGINASADDTMPTFTGTGSASIEDEAEKHA